MTQEVKLKPGDQLFVKYATGSYAKIYTPGYVYKVDVSDLGMAVKDDTGDWDYILVNEYLQKQLVDIKDKNGTLKASKAGPAQLAKAAVQMKMDKLAADKPAPTRKKPGPKPKVTEIKKDG